MAKKTKAVAAPMTIADQLTALLLADKASEALRTQFEEVKKQYGEMKGNKYAHIFNLAKRTASLAEFSEAGDEAKQRVKAVQGNIDRDVSNAVSQIKRFWSRIDSALDEQGSISITVRDVVYTAKQGDQVLAIVPTLNSLRELSEAVAKQSKPLVVGDAALTKKLALLASKVSKANPEQAMAALDAALAFFLVGKAPVKAKTATGQVRAKQKRVAKQATAA